MIDDKQTPLQQQLRKEILEGHKKIAPVEETKKSFLKSAKSLNQAITNSESKETNSNSIDSMAAVDEHPLVNSSRSHMSNLIQEENDAEKEFIAGEPILDSFADQKSKDSRESEKEKLKNKLKQQLEQKLEERLTYRHHPTSTPPRPKPPVG
jgi:hypothetical protein